MIMFMYARARAGLPVLHRQAPIHRGTLTPPLVRGMGRSFFSYALVTGGLSVPLQTVRTSNETMSMIVLVYVRLFEAACQCITLEGIGEKRPSHALPSAS
jgi:hypothetical protein